MSTEAIANFYDGDSSFKRPLNYCVDSEKGVEESKRSKLDAGAVESQQATDSEGTDVVL